MRANVPGKKRGPNKAALDKLTVQQELFISELLATQNFNFAEAARKAGYKSTSAVTKLLENPTVCAAIGRAKEQRLERNELKADDVLQYIYDGLMTNWLDYFQVGDQGWFCSKKELKKIPAHIGRLIENIEYVKVKEWDKTNSRWRYITRCIVTPISKSVVLGYAAKHTITEKHEHTHAVVDFNKLIEDSMNKPDLVAAQILEMKKMADEKYVHDSNARGIEDLTDVVNEDGDDA